MSNNAYSFIEFDNGLKYKLYEENGVKGAYSTIDDGYIGSMEFASKIMSDIGINPEKAKPTDNVCSIGFCEKEQKWYGWSHRAMFGFGIGHEVKVGNLGYRSSDLNELKESIALRVGSGETVAIDKENNRIVISSPMVKSLRTTEEGELVDWVPAEPEVWYVEPGRGEWVAKTLDDARQMAIDFANSVS